MNLFIFRYRKYPGLRQVILTKGETGLGIMIIEGKHPDAGTGVFISDLQVLKDGYIITWMLQQVFMFFNKVKLAAG